ncbi:MAG: hypothetical protein AAGA43_04930 [Bacteroidota bacterium]
MKKVFFLTVLVLFSLTSCSDDDQVQLNQENQILTFSFLSEDNDEITVDVNGVIDQDNKTVRIELPQKINISGLKPTITISESASISPNNQVVVDFSNPVVYKVEAENGSIQDYQVIVSLPKSSAKQVLSFAFLASDNEDLFTDVQGIIDEMNQTVTIEVPYGIALGALVPTLQISENGEANPGNKETIDFSNSVNYTIKAEDESTATYTVMVTNAALTDRDVLIAWYNLNPNNTLDWDFSKTIDEWEGITVDNGRVVQINIQDRGLTTMTPLIEFLTELNSLRLIGNNISVLPIQIGSLQKLRVLNLTANELKKLPVEIGNLTSLQSLVLHNNAIDEVPAEIGNLENLIQLDFTFNDLNSLPSEIGQLEELQSLSVYGSRQLAAIPSTIGNLTKLINLDLGWCNLANVPSTLGNLTSLTELRIDENGLQEVPKEIGNLVNLKTLQLQKNQLSQLPSELGDLSSLLVLFIEENQITSLPQELCDLIALNDISLNKDPGASCP